MIHAILVALLLLQTPAPPAPKPPWVVFPVVPTPEPPPAPAPAPPMPSPDTVPTLSQDEIYVIDCKEACFLLDSPTGAIKATQDVGPIRIRGRFVGGSGKPETRTFQGPTVFTIEAPAQGRVELIVVKVGAKGPDDVQRRIVDVLVGPRPPPVPADPLAAAIQAAYSADASATKTTDKTALAAVYRAVAGSFTGINTDTDLYTVVKNASDSQIDGRLRGVRNVLAAELEKILPTGTQAQVLTPAGKQAAVSLLTRFAGALEAAR